MGKKLKITKEMAAWLKRPLKRKRRTARYYRSPRRADGSTFADEYRLNPSISRSAVPKTARGIAKLIRKALRMAKRGKVTVSVRKVKR